MLVDDFNAHIASCDELVHERFDLLAKFECLGSTRLCGGLSSHTTNLAGRCLPDVASASPLLLTTGRGRGDQGQRTFKGHNGKSHTRLDHILLSEGLLMKF